MSKINLKLVIAMARSYNNAFGKIEKNIRSFDLTVSEFGVLEFLYHKGDQPVQEIAKKILVTSGTITYVINKLIEKDFVERKQCTNDKRIFYIHLTKKGERRIADIFPDHEKFLDELFKGLAEGEKNLLIEKLKKLSDL
jgi:MarR family 2-MHQ and catechol resistance regulon transcriptional repressor